MNNENVNEIQDNQEQEYQVDFDQIQQNIQEEINNRGLSQPQQIFNDRKNTTDLIQKSQKQQIQCQELLKFDDQIQPNIENHKTIKNHDEQEQSFEIIINYLHKNITILVYFNTVVQEIINVVKQLYQVNENINLKLDDQILPNNQTIKQLQIKTGSLLTVDIFEQEQSIEITINYLNQNTPILVDLDTTVQEIIDTIAELYQINEKINLKLDDQILPNNQTIKQLQIKTGSLLTVDIFEQEQSIEITINYLNQNTPILVDLDTTVQEIIDLVKQLYEINENINLKLDDQILPNNQTIKQLQFKKGQLLTVDIFEQEQIIQITINYLHQNTPILVNLDTTVQEIIDTIAELYQINENINLKLDDQILPNNQTIKQLQIKKGSLLTVDIFEQEQSIEITINYLHQYTPILVNLDTTVQEIIDTIAELYQINEKINLKLDDQILPNNQTIKQLQIKTVDLDTTVQEIINLVKQLYEINENINLKLEDQILPNNKTIKQLKIKKGSFLTTHILEFKQIIILFLNYRENNIMIEVNLDTTVQEIIDTIAELYQINENITLKLDDQILPNNQTIKQLQIKKGSLLKVDILEQEQIIQIIIDYLHQYTPILVNLDTTVQEIIDTIAELYQINENITLKLDDQILPNNQTIKQLQIKKGSLLTVDIFEQEQSIEITINYLHQYTPILVNLDTTVQEIIDTITDLYQINENINLKLDDSILPNNFTLRQLQIQNAQILLVFQIRQ
ncbi:unnamed protein product [Paramecium sonneborni]|uniref:Ubiquitin-like domain-containing protein n=1 Tax=Paramecium sonneborni TaxID=65129 RepID=A0A8S1R0J9_9CILI|nr:unnamed protein product [Paramecium sonneborni]